MAFSALFRRCQKLGKIGKIRKRRLRYELRQPHAVDFRRRHALLHVPETT